MSSWFIFSISCDILAVFSESSLVSSKMFFFSCSLSATRFCRSWLRNRNRYQGDKVALRSYTRWAQKTNTKSAGVLTHNIGRVDSYVWRCHFLMWETPQLCSFLSQDHFFPSPRAWLGWAREVYINHLISSHRSRACAAYLQNNTVQMTVLDTIRRVWDSVRNSTFRPTGNTETWTNSNSKCLLNKIILIAQAFWNFFFYLHWLLYRKVTFFLKLFNLFMLLKCKLLSCSFVLSSRTHSCQTKLHFWFYGYHYTCTLSLSTGTICSAP